MAENRFQATTAKEREIVIQVQVNLDKQCGSGEIYHVNC
jgi:hypothetical protein